MANAAEYAQWITNNADKKGTPEFNTVANKEIMKQTANTLLLLSSCLCITIIL
jgi:hypothetical protein